MFRLLLLSIALGCCTLRAAEPGYAEIRFLDADTGHSIPLVELETVNGLPFVTDNAGRVAFHEPGLLNREIFFHVKSHGYEVPKDGFGFAGVRLTPKLGAVAIIKLKRLNIAERLCRLTGEGLYRDTLLLGHELPLKPSANPGLVAGQDSIQSIIYRGKVLWLWGDTNRMGYPLGLFRMAGATTPLPDAKFDPAAGIAYNYFVNAKTGFARAMMPLPERPEGVVWISALCVVPDEKGTDKLVAHYSRRKGLADELEQGLCLYNDEKQIFEVVKQLPLEESWRRPSGHPIVWENEGQKWLLFGSPSPTVRVPATLQAVLDPKQYEAFTNARTKKGEPMTWRWQRELPPTDSKAEFQLFRRNLAKPDSLRFLPANAANAEERITLHSGSVRWNAYRQRWVMLACQIGGQGSYLGEVWYAEANSPTGPFDRAVKIITHDRQTLYNVCHHDFLDQHGGRVIYLEGTYTNEFSGNEHKTPRYNYNQILYRLDLGDNRLTPAHCKSR